MQPAKRFGRPGQERRGRSLEAVCDGGAGQQGVAGPSAAASSTHQLPPIARPPLTLSAHGVATTLPEVAHTGASPAAQSPGLSAAALMQASLHFLRCPQGHILVALEALSRQLAAGPSKGGTEVRGGG